MKVFVKCMLTVVLIAGASVARADEQNAVSSRTIVIMKTNMGTIEIELFPDKAPLTVTNFLSYVAESFYDGTIFHRVVKNFMIQGGGFTAKLRQKTPKAPIKNEATNRLKNKHGTIAMARTQEVDSATCQFFINHADNGFLDHKNKTSKGFGYCVFGKVIKGMDVVDRIAAVSVEKSGSMLHVPAKSVIIESLLLK